MIIIPLYTPEKIQVLNFLFRIIVIGIVLFEMSNSESLVSVYIWHIVESEIIFFQSPTSEFFFIILKQDFQF